MVTLSSSSNAHSLSALLFLPRLLRRLRQPWATTTPYPPMLFCTIIVREASSASPSTWRTIHVGPIYARPVLATPMRVFVLDVSPDLANPVRHLVYDGFDNIIFDIDTLLDDCLDHVPVFFLAHPCNPDSTTLPCMATLTTVTPTPT